MTPWLGTRRRAVLLVPALLLGGALSGCDDGSGAAPSTGTQAATQNAGAPGSGTAPAQVPTAQVPMAQVPAAQAGTASAVQDTPAQQSGDTTQSTGILPNDPSAPADTPLCGLAAQQSNAMSRQLLARQYAEAGSCATYACYDPATATYIGADGYRHVCR